MSSSTGPILTAGAITWANTVLLGGNQTTGLVAQDLFTQSVRIGIGTGLAAGILYGVERLSGDLATALAWAAVVTVLFVRVPPDSNNPTPLERALSLV